MSLPAAGASRARYGRETLHAEWTKLRTLASTGWLLLGVVAATVIVGAAVSASLSCTSTAACHVDVTKLSLTGTYLGQAVVAIGNPQGLKHSVVAGVVSGRREFEGRPMIQLAIPIEPGNSGGPLVDMQGRVHGILTIKSLVTENLGFAVAINSLKPLLAKPNPVPMAAWLTIGTLDAEEWQPLKGGRWRQRAGRILADGAPGELLAGDSVPEVAALMAMPRRQAERINALTAASAHG